MVDQRKREKEVEDQKKREVEIRLLFLKYLFGFDIEDRLL